MANDYYKLVGKTPVPCSIWEFTGFMEGSNDRVIAQEQVGESMVSTVFLDMNHAFGDGPPILFETLVLGGVYDQEQERYYTYEEAEAGHAVMLAKVKSGKPIESPVASYSYPLLTPQQVEAQYPHLWAAIREAAPSLTAEGAARLASLMLGTCGRCHDAPKGCECWKEKG